MASIPSVPEEQLLEALEEFDLSCRGLEEWQGWAEKESYKYAISRGSKLYPVKTIISMATGMSVRDFSGGAQSNNYVGQRGLQVVSLRSDSWTIESGVQAYKVLDKSAFLHRGTGIPIEIRSFFIYGHMAPGDSRPVKLLYGGQGYAAHIDMDKQPTPRTRLFWNSDFVNILKQTFPHHHSLYQQGQEPESKIILRLKRVSGFDSYQVSFSGEVSEETAAADVDADDVENGVADREGAVVTYYGKRYERSLKNRKEAIRIHGLSCNACGFNFEKIYGSRGADYIEVHHIKPIHSYEQEQHVDPKTDLITVCSNCHRMIHRKPSEVLSVDELKEIIRDI